MSQPTYVEHVKYALKRGLVNNSTEGDFPAVVPIGTEPASVDLSSDPSANLFVGNCTGSELQLFPFGTDADNEAFVINVYLWRRMNRTGPGVATPDLWVPRYVGGFTATLSAALNGVAGAPVTQLEFFADTIVELATNTLDDNIGLLRSFAADQLAEIRINTIGYEKFSVTFDLGTAASANIAYASR